MKHGPRITFGIIVLNGEPFTRYNLRSLYPFAHEIIVAEGASVKARSIATPDGHSLDGTLENLRRFKEEEDPDNKLTIITAEDMGYPDGFWPGDKDEQSRAYSQHASGDYLWQVDIDEFYKSEDITSIIDMILRDPAISQINVPWLNFWGTFDILVDGLFLRKHYQELGGGVPRIFKWGDGYKYLTHRPPTVSDADGKDTRQGILIKGTQLAEMGIYCYHYATIFPQLVRWKMRYYQSMDWNALGNFIAWYDNEYKEIRRPFRVHHVMSEVSWLTPFPDSHPGQIEMLKNDISTGTMKVNQRRSDDIQRIINSRLYRIGAALLSNGSSLLLNIRKHAPRLSTMLVAAIEYMFSPRITSGHCADTTGDR